MPVAEAQRANTPAQDLMDLNEMRRYLAAGILPEGFRGRVESSLEFRELATSPQVHYSHSSPFAVTDLLDWDEQARYLAAGILPDDFRERVQRIAAEDVCTNCDGVRNMATRLRDWFDGDLETDDCPACC